MKTHAVLFDFGGTLLSYNREEIFRSLLEENALRATRDEVSRAYEIVESDWYTQLGTQPINDDALEQLDLMVLENLNVEGDKPNLAKYITKNWWRMEEQLPASVVRRAYPDAVPCLREIERRGVKMGIVSNIESEERLRNELESIGLSRFFPILVASGSVGVSKPFNQIFKLAADRLGVQPRQTIFVGDDYDRDYVGAQNAGMRPVLLDRSGIHASKRGILRVDSLETIPSLL